MEKRKILLSFVALGLLLASLALACNMFGKGIRPSFAQSPGVTVTDFWLNGGQEPWGTTFDSKGNVWVAVPGCDPAPTCSTSTPPGEIEAYNPATSSWIATYQLPSGYAQPLFLAFDAQGNLWFPMPMANAIGTLNPQTKTFQEFPVPTAAAGPWDIAIDHHGNIWWTEGWVGMIGELHIAQATPGTNNGVTEYAYPAPCTTCGGTHASGIGVDSSGQVWFDDSLQGIFGSFPDTGTGSFSVYAAPTQNAHPHDGLNVDGQNRIWFTEEFANKLAEAVQNVAPSPSPGLTPSPGTTLARDTFGRANQQHWGRASDGHTWGADANSSSVFSINNKTGRLANGSSAYNAVLGPVATDSEVIFSGSLSSFKNTTMGALLRWKDKNDWYRAAITGSSLVVQKRVNGTSTTLKSIPFAATAGTSYTIDFSVVGATLSARVWKTSAPEPSGWMVTVADSSLSSGSCGLRVQLQSGIAATITSFLALS